jgi:hypothetical protein
MASSSTEMAIFQRVAERGSFAGAAEDAGLSPSAVQSSSRDWSNASVCVSSIARPGGWH